MKPLSPFDHKVDIFCLKMSIQALVSQFQRENFPQKRSLERCSRRTKPLAVRASTPPFPGRSPRNTVLSPPTEPLVAGHTFIPHLESRRVQARTIGVLVPKVMHHLALPPVSDLSQNLYRHCRRSGREGLLGVCTVYFFHRRVLPSAWSRVIAQPSPIKGIHTFILNLRAHLHT